jgi:hypothetical protein
VKEKDRKMNGNAKIVKKTETRKTGRKEKENWNRTLKKRNTAQERRENKRGKEK